MSTTHSHNTLIYPGLEYSSRGPLVLLFYDGYELRAMPGLAGGMSSQSRRMLRFAKRTVFRQQVRTGFYTAFLALANSLTRAGCNVRINDFVAARARPHYPIGLAGYPSIIDKISLPNPRIFGPGDFGTPPASAAVAADPRFRKLIQPSDWFSDMYRPYCGDKMLTWFAGIDTRIWPDFSTHSKPTDFLVYDKIRWHREERVPSILNRITGHLDATGRSYTVLRYGHHYHVDFLRTLKRSTAMLFICEHETQGLAYQEALATNVPVLAWDEGEMVDPLLQPYVSAGLAISSVPYFSPQCGMTFTMDRFETTCAAFWQKLHTFRPRQYVEQHLSFELSARQYLAEYVKLLP